MAPTDALPRIRKHDDAGGRYGSSRDHYTSRDERRGDRDRDRDNFRNERRRSRSPHRRRREHETDTYSSSRDYRAREREDRYGGHGGQGGQGGHGERGWDRDRGRDDRGQGRRDPRRDDYERPRRDRGDLFEGRQDRGGRDRDFGKNDRDEFAMQARKREESPRPKKREPTPDLTDVSSVLDRKRRLTQWDIKPPGYENVTAEQAKLSGMFPLPGAPRQQPMDPSRLQAFMNQPSGSAGSAALKPSNARQSKRLFASNVPPAATEESLVNFLNLQLNGLNVISSVDPCISAQVNQERTFALLEFKNPSDATVALAFDGIAMDDDVAMGGTANGGPHGLVIRRPKDYIVPSLSVDEEEKYTEGEISSVVPDTPNKLSITGLLPGIQDAQVLEIIGAFGQLKAFVLVKDSSTEEPRGIAFCEYLDASQTDATIEGLNNLDIGGKLIKVQRASIGISQASGMEMGVSAMSMLAGGTSDNLDEGRVLQLLNMVTPEELMDNEEYEEICEDIKDECNKYGTVLDMKIPRPSGGSRQSNGVGKIYVKFDTPDSAHKALQALAGRKFADRTVVTTYFSEESYEVNAW